MSKFTRRSFIKGAAVATTGALFAEPWSAYAAKRNVLGANDEIRCAVIGFRSRGKSHIDGINKLRQNGHKVRVAALCDVDADVLAAGAKKFTDAGESVETFVETRELIESGKVDAVMIATPNHWHSLSSIWAIQAGLDVYVEKPVSHNVWEGRQLVKAARKYDAIVQTGTQCRSSSAIRDAVKWVQDGNLGEILIARGLCYKPRGSIGRVAGPQPVPEQIHFNEWLGPAEEQPFPLMRENLHYDWHWVWNTGNGDVGNQGIHQMDIARWFLGEKALAPRVWSVGGRLGYVDDGETPNSQIVYHGYEKAPLIFEVRGLREKSGSKDMDKFMGASIGVIIHCAGGHVVVPNYSSAIAYDKSGKEIKSWKGAEDHFENWIRAVRSRKTTDLTADIEEGHISSALCHVGNISHRSGGPASRNQITDAIREDMGAIESQDRLFQHLAANDVNLVDTPLTLGAELNLNPSTERFKDNALANRLLSREYRKGFVVPKRV